MKLSKNTLFGCVLVFGAAVIGATVGYEVYRDTYGPLFTVDQCKATPIDLDDDVFLTWCMSQEEEA